MLYVIFYFFLLIVELIIAISLCIFTGSLILSSIMGAPYVPTKNKELLQFLKEAGLKKGQVFLELGCGDGRVVRTAVKEYGVKGIGIDVNPTLILWAKMKTKFYKVPGVIFRRENVFNTDLKDADVIYLFLMPELVKKLLPKMKKELKKNTLIISHGFKVEGWEKSLFKTIPNKPFPTYYYRFNR